MCELVIKKEMTTARIKNKKSPAETVDNSRIDPPVEKMWTTVLEKAVGWLPTIFPTGSIFSKDRELSTVSIRTFLLERFYLEEKKQQKKREKQSSTTKKMV